MLRTKCPELEFWRDCSETSVQNSSFGELLRTKCPEIEFWIVCSDKKSRTQVLEGLLRTKCPELEFWGHIRANPAMGVKHP